MQDAFICDAICTPIGRYGGALSSVRTDDLAVIPIKALMSATRASTRTRAEWTTWSTVASTRPAGSFALRSQQRYAAANVVKFFESEIEDGTVTPGNASGVNDGACALLIASEKAVKAHGLTPRARILGAACTRSYARSVTEALAVGNSKGDYFAVTRRCRHPYADLAGGKIDSKGRLVCP